jgi:hypothetical protein
MPQSRLDVRLDAHGEFFLQALEPRFETRVDRQEVFRPRVSAKLRGATAGRGGAGRSRRRLHSLRLTRLPEARRIVEASDDADVQARRHPKLRIDRCSAPPYDRRRKSGEYERRS